MEEVCLSCLPLKKKRASQQITIASSVIPIYVITQSFLSPSLPALQQFLQTHNILHSFQDQKNVLKKLPKTYQDRFFIVLNDLEDSSCLSGEFENITCEFVTYSEQSKTAILNKYKAFTQEVQKMGNSAGKKTQSNDTGETSCAKGSQEEGQNQQTRSKIILKCVSKIKHSYKSGWPKRLFIYSNKNDDMRFEQYIDTLKGRQFKDTVFIEHIQEYLKQLPNKQDQLFAILMSQYSALNLRMYFKKSDQILLLAENQEECMPLLRGKVTYLTALTQTMDSFLKKEYDMKINKQSDCKEQKAQRIQSGVSERNSFNEKAASSSSSLRRSKQREEDRCFQSVLNYKITPQISLVNQLSKQLRLQSNIIAVSIAPQISGSIGPEVEKKNQQKQQLREPVIFQKQGIGKSSPLQIVHMQRVSVLNISHHSSESEEVSMFDEISNVDRQEQEGSRDWQFSKGSMKENVKESQEYGGSSNASSSYSSKYSRNSRIFDRARERAKVKRKINFDNM